jgi:threonine/homoserine/homoserine lactone efflux protein
VELIYLLRGLAVGFSLAAPVGPIGILCIRRTLAQGSKRGLFVGLGAATADMMYGIVAAFGVTLISNFITDNLNAIRLVGGVILLILGYRTFRSHPATDTKENESNGHTRAFLSVFFLTLSNPMTLIAFAAVFAGIGLERIVGDYSQAGFLVAGIFLGSFSWFSLLTTLVHFFREKISTAGIVIVNKIAGTLLILFGLFALWSGATRL